MPSPLISRGQPAEEHPRSGVCAWPWRATSLGVTDCPSGISHADLPARHPARPLHPGLRRGGAIRLAQPPAEGQIQPASLDLRLGEKAYRVRASFLPGRTERSGAAGRARLARDRPDPRRCAGDGLRLHRRADGGLKLPAGLRAAANPKSSTGRLDVFTRVITDRAREFDLVEDGYEGPLFIEISPRTFPVLVRSGSRLSQIRFRAGEAGSTTGRSASCTTRDAWSRRPSPPSRAASPSASICPASTG